MAYVGVQASSPTASGRKERKKKERPSSPPVHLTRLLEMASNFWALGRWTSRSRGQTSLAMSISSWLRRATLTAKFSSLSVRRRFGIKRKAEVCNGERVSRRYRNLWLVGCFRWSKLKPCSDKAGREFSSMRPNDCKCHPSYDQRLRTSSNQGPQNE